MLNHPKTYKWDNQGAVLFHSLLNQKDTQEKLGKLRFDLDSSSNTNAIQKTVKQFTEFISECVDKTLRTTKRGKVNKKPKKSNQIDFCKGFRTADHVLTIKTLINKYLSENKKLYFCFVDFRKAYDSIWLEALFKKLLDYGVSANFVSLLRNMYEKTKLSVRLTRGITEFSSLKCRTETGM